MMMALLLALTSAAEPADSADPPTLAVDFAAPVAGELEVLTEIRKSVNLGLAGGWRTRLGTRELAARATWTTPLFLLNKPSNHRLEVSVAAALVGVRSWTLVASTSLGIHAAHTVAHRSLSLPGGLALGFGPHGERFYGEFRLSNTWIMTSHIRHSVAYREVLPAATDGWYAPMGGWWSASCIGGFKPIPRLAVLLMAGLETTHRGRLPQPPYDFAVPWIADLRVRLTWP
jgi:hypothetical protein